MITAKKKLLKKCLCDDARIRLSELESTRDNIIKSREIELEGNIRVAKNGNRSQFYLRNDPKDKCGNYISVSDKVTITSYLQKKYNVKILKLVSKEIKCLEKFLKEIKLIESQIQSEYSDLPEDVKKYIEPIDMSDEDYINEWLSEPYTPKTIGDNVAEYWTDKGERVRSKSELNIANALYKLGIPYKYECPLMLKNGLVVYPDFTVLNIQDRCIVYWEHRGMMDDRDYLKHSVLRIKDFSKSDIILGKNLIITEETSSIPLSTSDIMLTIQAYFGEGR